MRLIDADDLYQKCIEIQLKKKNRYFDIDDVIKLIKKAPTVDVLDKIRAEIDEISLSEPIVSADGLYCYGSKSITMGHFREKVFEIIDKYRGE
jgi:hypothetical protein